MTSRDKGSSWCTHGVHMYKRRLRVRHQGTYRKHGSLMEDAWWMSNGHEEEAWTLGPDI